MWKTLSQEKLLELVSDKMYVKYTADEVLVRDVTAHMSPDAAEVVYVCTIEFVSTEPSVKALEICRATKSRQVWGSYYSGHPEPEVHIWEATISLEYLTPIPYGTKAAEVLFAKKD